MSAGRGVMMEAGLIEAVAGAIGELISCDPMWIDDDLEPLGYSHEREARIADFVDAAARAAVDTVRRVQAA